SRSRPSLRRLNARPLDAPVPFLLMDRVGILVRLARITRLDEVREFAGSVLDLAARDLDGLRGLEPVAIGIAEHLDCQVARVDRPLVASGACDDLGVGLVVLNVRGSFQARSPRSRRRRGSLIINTYNNKILTHAYGEAHPARPEGRTWIRALNNVKRTQVS